MVQSSNTRRQIIECADVLFYQKGYGATSFADIARAVEISRGNFYHHFKTKDELLDAVLERRLQVRRALMLRWESEEPCPEGRLRCFIRILVQNQSKIELYGCPLGTLSAELHKLEHPAQEGSTRLFNLFSEWLARQFRKAGLSPKRSTHAATHLLARSQGIATLAQVYKDPRFIRREVGLLDTWLQAELNPR